MSAENPKPTKGETTYWRAVILWCIAAALASITYSLHPTMSVSGKLVIVVGLAAITFFLFRGADWARYTAGVFALLGIMMNFTASCAVFDKETQFHGLAALGIMLACIPLWHALLISADVNAYLPAYRKKLAERKNNESSDEDA